MLSLGGPALQLVPSGIVAGTDSSLGVFGSGFPYEKFQAVRPKVPTV